VVAVGCGKDSPNEPTPRSYTYQVTTDSDIAARAFACPIEMGAGT
jgi:hypothetical protein